MRPSSMPTHSMGRSQRSRCAGLTIGSMERTASVQSSNIAAHLSTAAERRKILSDFRRVHADFPLFVHSNRQPPAPERRSGWTTRFLGSCSVSSRMPRAAGRRAVQRSLSNRRKVQTSAQAGGVSQARENRADNFFTFVTEAMHEVKPATCIALVSRRSRVHFRFTAEMTIGPAADFMRISRIRWRKAACHGRLRAYDARKIDILSTVEREVRRERRLVILRRKTSPIDSCEP